MARDHLRLRDSGEKTEKAECQCCQRGATHWIRVSESYMRGDDDFYDVCERHLKIAQENLSRFFGHYRTKDKHAATTNAA